MFVEKDALTVLKIFEDFLGKEPLENPASLLTFV
jgi:hypothetical protein